MKRESWIYLLGWSGLLTGCVVQMPAPVQSPGTTPSPSATNSVPSPSPVVQVPRENRTCVTTDHFAKVVWRDGQPWMTFGLKPDAITLNKVAAKAIGNPDGSLTYEARGEATFYSRIYADNNCFVQIVSANGQVMLEEPGQVGKWPLNQTSQNFRPQPEPPKPSPTPLSLTCSGTIQDSVNFTAYYNRETGFTRLELRPLRSEAVLMANLAYDGKNEQGQGIWRGGVNNMADATLVHLSPAPVQRGDEISVGYDTRWGRGTCN